MFVSGVSARRPQIHLTQEQQQILSHNIQDDHVVKIIAFAGTVRKWNWRQCPYMNLLGQPEYVSLASGLNVYRRTTLQYPFLLTFPIRSHCVYCLH